MDKTDILKWQTGTERWDRRGFDEAGTLVAADGKLFVQSGKCGMLTIVEAGPSGYRELRKMKVFEDAHPTFTSPVLAGGRIFCRSYAGDVVCLLPAPSR